MARRGAIAALWDAVHLAGKAAMAMLRAPTGEAGLARMVGPYGGGAFGGSLSKAEQVLHFRGWNYRCIDYICSRIAKEPPCAVLAADPREAAKHRLKTKAFLRGRGDEPEPRAWVSPMWRRKAHGPAKPNEEYEFLGDDSPLVRLLQDPNDPETGVSVWYELELFICLTGEGYLWVVEGDDGRPAELWVIPSHWVRPVCLGQDLLIDYFEVSPRGGSAGLVRFDPDELIFFKLPSPLSKLIGASPVQAFATTIDSYEMTDSARYFSLQNGATVGGTIVVPPGTQLTPDMIDRLESRFAAKYAGVKNISRPIVLEGGAQYVPAPPEQELAFMQSLDQLRKYVIGGLWGLDDAVVGFAGQTTRAGLVATIANVNENVINPRRRARAATLTEKLAKRFDKRARIFYPDDTPLDPDAVRSDFTAATTANAASPNDWRTHILGVEPWPEGIYDRPLISPGLANPVDTSDWDEEHEGDDTNELRGTVGGLQAISSMQQQFYAGTIPREAAVAAMQTLFGMSPEEAAGLFPEVAPKKLADDGQGSGGVPALGAGGGGDGSGGGAEQSEDAGANPELGGALDDGQDPFAGLVDDAQVKAWTPDSVDYADPAPYGYCPECRTPGVSVERRLNGDAHCANGHAYPRKKAKYACAMAPINGAARTKLLSLAAMVPDADLGEDGREENPHVTVRYGLHADGPETVAAVLKNAGPIKMTLGGLSAFRGSDADKPYDVIFAEVNSPDLYRLNEALKALPHTDTWATYKPHATVAYVTAGLADKYLALLGGVGESCSAACVDFSTADKRHFTIPLGRPKKIVGRWFRKDHGPPPFPGGVFDPHRHRWVKPQAGDDPANHHHAALAEHMPPEVFETPGVWEKVKDAAATVAAKAYTRLVSATPAALKVMAGLQAVFDVPDDLRKSFGYNPTVSAGGGGQGDSTPTTHDPLRALLTEHVGAGVSTHLACTVASHVLSRASLWARKKLTGKDAGDGWTDAAELIAEVLTETNAALGLDGVPDVAAIAAGLKELTAGTDTKAPRAATPKPPKAPRVAKPKPPKRVGPPGPPPRPGLVWNEQSRRWNRVKEEPKAKPDKAQIADAANKFLAADAASITPEQLDEFGKAIGQLTVPEIQKLQAAHAARGGKNKADRIKKLVERAKALKDKAKPEPKPTPPESPSAAHREIADEFGKGSWGTTSVQDLRAKLGIPDDQLARGLEKLADAGKIQLYKDDDPARAAAEGRPMVRLSNGQLIGTVSPLQKVTPEEVAAAFGGPRAKPVAPEPKPEKPANPTASAPPESHALAVHLSDAIGKSPGLSAEQKAEYTAAASKVIATMPTAAADRAAAAVKNVTAYASTGHLLDGLIDTSKQPTTKAALETVKAKGGVVGGAMAKDGTLHIDGGYKSGQKGKYAGESGHGTTAGIHAHELAHAVDGPAHELSGSPEWRQAFDAEIKHDKAGGGEPKLTAYAGTQEHEGFAEFGRLLYGSDLPTAQIRKVFPKSSAFFASQGLFPADRGGEAGKLSEVFDKAIPIDGGAHADTLKQSEPATPKKPAGATATGHPAPKVTTTADGHHTGFAPGHEEAAAKKYGAAVADEIQMGAEENDGYVSLGQVAGLVKRKHPEATDNDIMAAASWLQKNDVVEGHGLNEVHSLTDPKSDVSPLNGGKDEKTATLWKNGKALHYWMGHRSGDTRGTAAAALSKLGGGK